MSRFYDLIVVSPHLDDAVLSCGGQIAQQRDAGQSVLVVTVMAGDPQVDALTEFAALLHDRWQLPSSDAGIRRREDIAACRVLGADYRHWDIPDCIYRLDAASGQPLYTSEASIFGEVHGGELQLVTSLARQLAALPRAAMISVPLGIGHHVDHQITRMACELIFGTSALVFYEDSPYASNRRLRDLMVQEMAGWSSRIISISEEALKKKCDAIACYRSQISTFFENEAAMRARVSDYVTSMGGEHLWYYPPDCGDQGGTI